MRHALYNVSRFSRITGHLPRRPGVYLMTNTVNGDCYVGSSANLRARASVHLSKMLRGVVAPKILASFRATGEQFDAFEFKVLEECEVGIRRVREAFWVESIRPNLNGHAVLCPFGGDLKARSAAARARSKLSRPLASPAETVKT